MNITNPTANLDLAEEILVGAQRTPQGRARIALASALGDTPGWFTPLITRACPDGFRSQEVKTNFVGLNSGFSICFRVSEPNSKRGRAEMSPGTRMWTMDSTADIAVTLNEVWALYQTAGLSLSKISRC